MTETGEKHIIRAIGKGHSPNEICAHKHLDRDLHGTKLHMINMNAKMNKILKIDSEKKTICIEGGVTLSQVIEALRKEGSMCLSNLPSISDITVAGAIATGSHGTGLKN